MVSVKLSYHANQLVLIISHLDSNTVHETLKSNYYGTLEATQTFLPLIRDGGRLVNVSSLMCALSKYSKAIQNSFLSAKTPAGITALMEEFEHAVKAGKERENGWPQNAYAVSKAGVTGLTLAIADEEKRKGSKTLINACCPGYVNTDMTKGNGYLTPDQGAKMPVLLALGDIGEQTGLFWMQGKPAEW
jgi:carbonyl reductase 1